MPVKGKELISETGAHIEVVAALPYTTAQNHLGNAFIHSDIHTGLASAATVYHHLKTGATAAHIKFFRIIATGAPLTINYYEGATISADGTSLGIGNTNRESSKVANTTAYEAPTITDLGTQIGANLIPSITQQGGGSLDIIADGEWILKPNTSYLWSVTNNDNSAVDFETTIQIYEPDLR